MACWKVTEFLSWRLVEECSLRFLFFRGGERYGSDKGLVKVMQSVTYVNINELVPKMVPNSLIKQTTKNPLSNPASRMDLRVTLRKLPFFCSSETVESMDGKLISEIC